MITSPYFLQAAGNVQPDPLLKSFVAVKSSKSAVFMELQPEEVYFVRYKKDGVYVKEQYNSSVRNLYVEADPGTEIRLYGTNFFSFSCRQNQITEFNATADQADLATLTLNNNQLQSLDLSGLTGLASLSVTDNDLTSLVLPKGNTLQSVNCSDNLLTSLDVSGNTALVTLNCWSNRLTSINVDGCTHLKTLSCYGNMLSNLILADCAETLTKLEAQNNSLDGIFSFSDYQVLSDLKLHQNLLTGLVLPEYKTGDKMAALLYNNPFLSDEAASTEFVTSLPAIPEGVTGFSISINGTEAQTIKTGAEAKNWKVTLHA